MTVLSLDLDKLAAAKLWLTSPSTSAAAAGNAPYLSAAMYSLVTVACSDVETMAADEQWRLYVNPLWLDASEVRDVAAAMTHAVLHLLLDHAGRARSMQVGTRESTTWHQAADVAIGEQLSAMELPLAADAIDPRLVGKLSTEERYTILQRLDLSTGGAGEEPDGPCGGACDGSARPYELPPDADVGGLGGVAGDEVRKQVAIAYQGWQRHYPPGTEPGEWGRFVSATLEPVVPWPQVLASAIRRAVAWTNGLVDYSYSRPSRRQSAVRSVVLPAMRRPQPDIAIVVDTSGSVDDGLLAQALAEVGGALAACGTADSSVRVLSVDSAAHTVQRVRRTADVRLVGGGGTDMGYGVTAAASMRPRPDVVIVLTDGWTPWPSAPPPGIVVVVALLGRDRAELPSTPGWATRVECVA